MEPTDVVQRFIAAINDGDVDALTALMTDDHSLELFDEPPVVGRASNGQAWRGYAGAYPQYRIHVRHVTERDGVVAVLGHTTGSHLGLPDEEEARETLIWLATVADGLVRRWQLIEDDVGNRERAGLASDP